MHTGMCICIYIYLYTCIYIYCPLAIIAGVHGLRLWSLKRFHQIIALRRQEKFPAPARMTMTRRHMVIGNKHWATGDRQHNRYTYIYIWRYWSLASCWCIGAPLAFLGTPLGCIKFGVLLYVFLLFKGIPLDLGLFSTFKGYTL